MDALLMKQGRTRKEGARAGRNPTWEIALALSACCAGRNRAREIRAGGRRETREEIDEIPAAAPLFFLRDEFLPAHPGVAAPLIPARRIPSSGDWSPLSAARLKLASRRLIGAQPPPLICLVASRLVRVAFPPAFSSNLPSRWAPAS
ncbi:hypothetical protein E2562_010592 [Oryza meyeriana var. granulata]|uniref:Uncharacterized protein n=1 Tax=Oryza meyeriana var. granulata TaxID=110450 RepID=A0A6G1BW63_9ORYZ|nr:hypothetical protein E2562_010592 [Oryza meyeriana var. granulata]